MMPLNSRNPISLLIACLLFGWSGMSPVRAQTDTAPNAEPGTELPAKGDIIFMRNQAGEPIPVRKNAWVEKYLEWLESQENAPADQLPQYSIDRLTLTGVANDRLVDLDAVLTIRIRKKNGAVTVPLQFNEAVLKNIVHSGEGDLAFNGLKNNTGYEWKISGEGTHEIRLKLSVPITRQLSSSRLQLRLPPTAVGSLELEVGMRDAAFKTPARTAFKITPRGDSTAITLFGLTENLDLTWQPAPESRDARPVLQADTTIETRITTDYVLLTATQKISAASGSFQQLEVRLPAGYELQSVTDKQEDLLESYSEIEGRPNPYLLQLASPVTGPDPVTFEWKLSCPLPEPGAILKIDGFGLDEDVRDVRLQSGRLYLSELPGYRLQERESHELFRTDVPLEKLPQFSRAFEFFRQPFSLALEVQKIQSLYSLDPRFELHVERNLLTWKADVNLSVQRGSVSQLTLQCPDWREAGWKFLEDEQSEMIARIDADPDDPSVRHVVFQRPLSGENIKLSLEAVKMLTDREAAEGVVLKLPGFPRRMVNGATELLVTSRSDLDVTLLDTGNLETLPDLPPRISEISDVVRRLRIPEFTQPQLTLSVVPRERVVNVTTDVAPELRVEDGTVLIRQSFVYDVRFEGIETLRWRVPAAIRESLSGRDENGNPLHLEFAEGTGEILIPVRITLPEPRTGTFTIQFLFEQKVPGPVAGNFDNPLWTMPLIQSSDAAARLVTLKLGPLLSELYEPDPDEWPQTDAADEVTYTVAGEAVRQEIVFQRKGTHAADGLVTVERCLHVTRTDDDGLIHTRSDFILNGQFESLTLRLPENYELEVDGIELNGKPIPREARQLSDRTLVVMPPGNAMKAHPLQQRLSVRIVSSEAFSLSWWGGGTLACEAPQLVEANRFQQTFPLASQRSLQTFWLVQLPPRQHLFLRPDGYSPEYLWQRQGLYWMRIPRKSVEELAKWVHDNPQELQDLLSTGGHAYLFSRFGTAEPLVLGNMHLKVVILAGGLLTLLISFMLLRLPATRNALTLLIMASAFAFLGVWYPTAVALLLQPAILGFCLAILAATLDYLFRRPQLPAVVTFEEPTAGSSQATGLTESVTPLSQIELGLGSDDPTQMQHREMHEEHVSSHLSSGE